MVCQRCKPLHLAHCSAFIPLSCTASSLEPSGCWQGRGRCRQQARARAPLAHTCRTTTSPAPACRSSAGSWLLEQKPAGPAMLGMREGGSTGAAYYVLSREGPDFVAVPVSQWLSFRLLRQCVSLNGLALHSALNLQAYALAINAEEGHATKALLPLPEAA